MLLCADIFFDFDVMYRATLAAASFMTVLLATTQGSILSTEELNEMIGNALQNDTIYVLQMDRDIAALIICNDKTLLTRFTPATGEAFFEVLPLKNYGEDRTNEILDSMMNAFRDMKAHVESKMKNG
jgi:hypothetical protein